MNIIKHMPSDEFDISIAMGIEEQRSLEIELEVKDIFEFVSQEKGLYEMSTIIEDCLNTIPINTAEALWTMVLVIKYEELIKHSPTKVN